MHELGLPANVEDVWMRRKRLPRQADLLVVGPVIDRVCALETDDLRIEDGRARRQEIGTRQLLDDPRDRKLVLSVISQQITVLPRGGSALKCLNSATRLTITSRSAK